ncbi:MAG: UDP-N-acetylglucosamine 2-epimerase (hydrolyzing) [Nitrospirae bacterium]|nr:UDP-N-acetylglucosamine 2-epimerase (hydrolyzing) [Nitrospirota bacterium]
MKVCIITSSRADYGIIAPLMRQVKSDSNMCLQVLVTGMHLSHEFGYTYMEVEKDGFSIDEKIEIILSSDTQQAICKSMALAMAGFPVAYERLKPDVIVVLGDRFEIFCAVTAAIVYRIPVAHIHGGELTEGAFDNAFRHCITKMSHLHFTSCEVYRQRVIQMGEEPEYVFNVGAIGIDNISNYNLLPLKELQKELGVTFNKYNLLVTFHPTTLEDNTSEMQFNSLLNALDTLEDTTVIFTKTNADTYGRIINTLIDQYVKDHSYSAVSFISLGQLRYLSLLQFVDAVVGNSSSGIIEAPSFKIGTIDIGDRQKGRVKANSVINCMATTEDIIHSIETLYSDEFQGMLKDVVNPYDGGGDAAIKIKDVLKANSGRFIIKKHFYDINISETQGISCKDE